MIYYVAASWFSFWIGFWVAHRYHMKRAEEVLKEIKWSNSIDSSWHELYNENLIKAVKRYKS